LLKVINTLSEAELKKLLEQELAGQCRRTFMERVHQRYSSLRMQRERHELMLKVKIA
jgi:hypothetical protein